MNLHGSRCQILNETGKNAERHAMSNPALYCIYPQMEKGFLTNLPHS